ncbi:MAG: type II toxin-antitoxin system VapC family toxin [Methanosphaera sp.]|nr:type II toxin-antitoxin system VapC family toxin [Methanosphaera sp.]
MIFLDSSYLIGLIIDNDQHHTKAVELKPYLKNEKKLINNTVLVETLNSIKRTNHSIDTDEIINSILKLDDIDFLTKNDYFKSLELFNYYNQSINYSDCTMLYTMQQYSLNTIVSFDSDFDKVSTINRIYLD